MDKQQEYTKNKAKDAKLELVESFKVKNKSEGNIVSPMVEVEQAGGDRFMLFFVKAISTNMDKVLDWIKSESKAALKEDKKLGRAEAQEFLDKEK